MSDAAEIINAITNFIYDIKVTDNISLGPFIIIVTCVGFIIHFLANKDN